MSSSRIKRRMFPSFSWIRVRNYPGSRKRHCRFEKIRFFVDPKRARALCADRRMTIPKRDEFAKALNEAIAEIFPNDFVLRDPQKNLQEVKEKCAEIKKDKVNNRE